MSRTSRIVINQDGKMGKFGRVNWSLLHTPLHKFFETFLLNSWHCRSPVFTSTDRVPLPAGCDTRA